MKLLLGVGGSELSYQALTETLERVSETGDQLTVAIFENEDIDADIETIQQRIQEQIDDSGLEPALRRVEGTSPGSELVNIAESEGFDRIVLGGGGRSPLGKIQLGPIVEFVLLNAQTPVTLIR
ncbi:universal stress protein [Haloarcula sp. CBA1130]|uniref:universal stress protein n=1 Tax=unclassified Haloarcula TaxID=2624677 RepID=UPI0012485468|nr:MULTISPECIES: universal stress protein [unclassified Haloarcula]KAA9399801.1 universal stress protein [Haloarcula sp. CBA1129]KAA9401496.1 universal stress protein [Haloarcula sp. CBA1130]